MNQVKSQKTITQPLLEKSGANDSDKKNKIIKPIWKNLNDNLETKSRSGASSQASSRKKSDTDRYDSRRMKEKAKYRKKMEEH